jgi:PIN like domain
MPSGHPDGLPELFLDRSLGRVQVPTLLRAAGLRVRTLAEEYGVPADEDVADIEWLAHAGRNRWPVLMKDERIRYRSAERTAVVTFGVQTFCLTNGNLRVAAMAEQFLAVIDQIAATCREPGPFLFAVSASGIRRVDL